LKENLKIGVDANKPSPLFLEEDNSSSLSSPFSVSPRPSSESDLSEIENVQSFEGQCTEIVDDFRKSSFPARKLKEENELL
jgi:hypothetical protein